MERIFKQVIEILNQNQVYHSVNQEDISKTDFCMVDVYSVNAIVKQQPLAKTVSKKRSKKIAEPQIVFVPILQIRHNPIMCNLKIFLDNECIYNNDNFQVETMSVGYNNNRGQSPEPSLKKILDICKTKSTKAHLQNLRMAKELLKEQRRILANVR